MLTNGIVHDVSRLVLIKAPNKFGVLMNFDNVTLKHLEIFGTPNLFEAGVT